MNMKAKKAAWNIHPGEILREEFLRPLQLTAYQLAKEIQVPAPRVNDIVLERRAITADTAGPPAPSSVTTRSSGRTCRAAPICVPPKVNRRRHLGRVDTGKRAFPKLE